MKSIIRNIFFSVRLFLFPLLLLPLSVATAVERGETIPNLDLVCQISESVSFIVKKNEPEGFLIAGYTFRGSELGNFSICTVPPARPPDQMVLHCEDQNLDYRFKLIFALKTQGQEFEILLEESSNPNERIGLLPCFQKN